VSRVSRPAPCFKPYRRHDLREQIERDLVNELQAKHVAAVPSTSHLAFASAPPAREEIRTLVNREGFDGILVARLAQRGTEYRHVPTADPFFGPPLGFYDYYWRAWPLVYSPTYLETVQIVALEVRLYDARDGGRLVYTATSDEVELDDAGRAVEAVSAALTDILTRAGLVATAPAGVDALMQKDEGGPVRRSTPPHGRATRRCSIRLPG
jgi:hypothetical protein